MDPLALAYYATICCALAGVAPSIPGKWKRFIIGALVGAASALVLPMMRSLIFA